MLRVNPRQIKQFFDQHTPLQERTIVVIDFANVVKWQESLGWPIGVRELAVLVKSLSKGRLSLRRFYYGEDYGPSESATVMRVWSKTMIDAANFNGLATVTKRVKYIHTEKDSQLLAKCDLDVEMTVDLIRERDNYDTVFLFSGDGDLSYALRYLHETYGKTCYVFGARNHVAREMIDAKQDGVIKNIMFAEDFEYRLSMRRRY